VPDVKAFFRHCPSCGRRFEIRLVGKKMVGSEASLEKEEVFAAAPLNPPVPLVLKEGETALVDVEEFEYTYRCKHCGHLWSEIREQEHMAQNPEGYTGDGPSGPALQCAISPEPMANPYELSPLQFGYA
jgi:hypothetical protein